MLVSTHLATFEKVYQGHILVSPNAGTKIDCQMTWYESTDISDDALQDTITIQYTANAVQSSPVI